MRTAHIFWDNSNIHFVGLNQVLKKVEPNVNPKLFRTYFKGLLQLASRNRKIGKLYMAGSIPPQTDSLWKHIRSQGIELELLERTNNNKENANDVSIQAAMLRTMADNMGKDHIFVVLTGDGAGAALGTGFLADLERVHKFGFKIEVISWESGCNRYLRSFAKKNGVFVPLETHYNKVTFIEGGRSVEPFGMLI
ncbi:NYN domain-containing protein [Aneurinibacillus aneurinilyticus]|uniref:NYN domain-containing protein n=1 Tax=Aneurinibacillus aneurinilyticus TaxID=1391 RepID=UPI0023F0E889|nr:NYN domain-containing protein [Aneurinibacillus aneurinilyticus]